MDDREYAPQVCGEVVQSGLTGEDFGGSACFKEWEDEGGICR